MAKDSKEIRVVWEYVESTPEEIESRLNKTFAILFEEMLKKEKINNPASLTKYGKPKFK